MDGNKLKGIGDADTAVHVAVNQILEQDVVIQGVDIGNSGSQAQRIGYCVG